MKDDSDTEDRPFDVSVIVIAYNRKQYIMKALDSIRTKDSQNFKIEIIVVKNFIDAATDHELNRIAKTVITTDKITLGAKMALGIKSSTSEILMFLEDDDIFLEGKFTSVINRFKDSTVGFVHNGYSIINEQGAFLRRSRRRNQVHSLNVKDQRNIFKILNMRGNFNLSCMSIRKGLVIEYLEDLEQFQVASDNFLFYIAIDSTFSLDILEEELSGYRIHDSNHSISSIFPFRDFVSSKISFLTEDIKALLKIEKILKNSNAKDVISVRILIPEMVAASLDSKFPDSLRALKVGSLIVSSIRFRNFIFLTGYFIFLSSRIIPDSGKILYFILERVMVKLNRI